MNVNLAYSCLSICQSVNRREMLTNFFGLIFIRPNRRLPLTEVSSLSVRSGTTCSSPWLLRSVHNPQPRRHLCDFNRTAPRFKLISSSRSRSQQSHRCPFCIRHHVPTRSHSTLSPIHACSSSRGWHNPSYRVIRLWRGSAASLESDTPLLLWLPEIVEMPPLMERRTSLEGNIDAHASNRVVWRHRGATPKLGAHAWCTELTEYIAL